MLPLGIGGVTPREREAIECLMYGNNSKETAVLMCIHARSVEGLLREARHRTAALTTCHLVAMYAARYSGGAVEPVTGHRVRDLERAQQSKCVDALSSSSARGCPASRAP